jgi:hypothetical protein
VDGTKNTNSEMIILITPRILKTPMDVKTISVKDAEKNYGDAKGESATRRE